MNRSGGVTAGQVMDMTRPSTQSSSPTTGSTVTVQESDSDIQLLLTPAGSLLALTVTLPEGWVGQRVTVMTKQAITTLTVNGAPSILAVPSSLVLGGAFEVVKADATTWVRLA